MPLFNNYFYEKDSIHIVFMHSNAVAHELFRL
jgi:hypothetical protein